ncbi:MAG: hypothetical protein MJY79_01765 [Bacteroidaceae bacterium]|nr:hypothetical protein [Bacteroidaceae bacterium]
MELALAPEELQCPELDKLFRISKFAAMDYDEQAYYLNQFMAEIDANCKLEAALDKGIEKGKTLGRAETARAMKAEGLAVELIEKCTGLSTEEIAKL